MRLRRGPLLSIAIGALLAACSPVEPPAPAASQPAPSPAARQPRAPRGEGRATTARDATAPSQRLEDIVSARDTYDTLRSRLGDGAIQRTTFHGAEGVQADGWVLFPDDPARRIEVWLDDGGEHPSSLVIRDASKWQRADGVRVGLVSTQLETLNRGPFEFAGFGWDYGGAVGNWLGGALAGNGYFAGPVILCEPANPAEDYPSGDAEFRSDLPIVRAQPPTVCEFGVTLASDDTPR